MIRMVATDGHRLAMMKMETGEKDFLTMEKGVIIPRKGLGEIRRLVEDDIRGCVSGGQAGDVSSSRPIIPC